MTRTDLKTIIITAVIVGVVIVGGLGLTGLLHNAHAALVTF